VIIYKIKNKWQGFETIFLRKNVPAQLENGGWPVPVFFLAFQSRALYIKSL
jgi:hypothetical protein